MANGQWAVVVRHVHRLFHGGSISGLTEGELLERFVSNRDEVAFGAIVARHGSMVLDVCRGVLDDPHDVEDAFQATFLVLVKKAAGLRDRDLLGQWLYGVARRVALRARSESFRKRNRQVQVVEVASEPVASLDAELRELQFVIREEVDRLSANDRMAVVLCYLEGLTQEEAAERLGWPVGTVKGRLSRAREKLRERLIRRGIALPAGALTLTMTRPASAAVPSALLKSTTLAAIQLVTRKTLTAGIVSANAVSLMDGVISTMYTTNLKIGAVVVAATCAVLVPGVMAYQGVGNTPAKKQGEPLADQAQSKPTPREKGSAATIPGPNAPPETEELARLSEQALKVLDQLSANGQSVSSPETQFEWSRRLAEAKSSPRFSETDRKAALTAHRDRMKSLVEKAEARVKAGQATSIDVMEAQYRLLEANRWLQEGKVGSVAATPPAADGGTFGGNRRPGGAPMGMGSVLTLNQTPADEERNEQIRLKLEDKISMNFASDTPLEDFKRYVEQSTQDEASGFPTGLPIYIDPDGLKDADATMTSTISINLEGIPLRTTLRLALRQVGLDYRIEGGLILISNRDAIVVQELNAKRGVPRPGIAAPGGLPGKTGGN